MHRISIVVPVYQGSQSLPLLVSEVQNLLRPTTTIAGNSFRVSELVLVDDCGPDNSRAVIAQLASEYDFVKPIWLARNYGQHAATLAGMSATTGHWILTIDEDGQHDPSHIATMLDQAISERAQVCYARPSNSPPHGPFRNIMSRIAKRVSAAIIGSRRPLTFSSFRLVVGGIGRSVAAYAGEAVYLDIALGWIVERTSVIEVEFREESRERSGYTLTTLLGHFWKLLLSSGTRPLRLVSALGVGTAMLGGLLAVYVTVRRIFYDIEIAGWASVLVIILVVGGVTLLSLGVIAEYLGLVVRTAFGKPVYFSVEDPQRSPHYGVAED